MSLSTLNPQQRPSGSGPTAARAGTGATLASVRFGQALSVAPSAKWKHPWTVTPGWNAKTKKWAATVLAGFVNGQCPIWRTTVTEQAQNQLDFGINPLTGKPFFSDPIFAQKTDTPQTRSIAIPLYLSPAIPLNFRAIGYDGDSQYPVPQFFLDRGAAISNAPPQLTVDSVDLPDQQIDQGPPPGLRLLRACDLWVHQPRLALTSDITINNDALITGTSIATQTLGLASAAPGDVLQVMSGTLQDLSLSAAIDPIAGDYTEPAYDELLIGTVFLLSPPNTPLGTEPDGNWTAYVRHNLFWNLNYVVPWFKSYGGDTSIPFIPPLAFGVAQPVINFELAGINDITQEALNLVTSHSMKGTFYTATGGGHSALTPSSSSSSSSSGGNGTDGAVPSSGNGLDKDGRLLAQAQAAAAARRSNQLDPDFPFNAQPFDPALLVQVT